MVGIFLFFYIRLIATRFVWTKINCTLDKFNITQKLELVIKHDLYRRRRVNKFSYNDFNKVIKRVLFFYCIFILFCNLKNSYKCL